MQETSTSKIFINNKFLIAFLILILIFILVFPYRGWTTLLIFFGGMILISFLYLLIINRGLYFEKESGGGWFHVGDEIEERICLHNRSWLPMPWVEIIGQSNLKGYHLHLLNPIGAEDVKIWVKKIACYCRGLYVIGPYQLITSDPFHIFSLTKNINTTFNMLVLPPIISIPNVQVHLGERSGEGKNRSSSKEQTTNILSVREYLPNDRFWRIHWPTSIRRGSLFVKTLESTPSNDCWIILDLYKEVIVGQEENSSFEHSIILAASLIDKLIQEKQPVGLIAMGDSFIRQSPKMSDAQKWVLLSALAAVQPGLSPLSLVIEQNLVKIGSKAGILIITSDLSTRWIPPLTKLQHHGGVVTVILLDPNTYGLKKTSQSITTELSRLGIPCSRLSQNLLIKALNHKINYAQK